MFYIVNLFLFIYFHFSANGSKCNFSAGAPLCHFQLMPFFVVLKQLFLFNKRYFCVLFFKAQFKKSNK